MPHGSTSEAYRNASTLSYLTAEQALADYAILLTDLKKNLSAEACPVVLFGGSYGGSKILKILINAFCNVHYLVFMICKSERIIFLVCSLS